MSDWIATKTQMPAPNQAVDWISPSGQQVNGGRYVGGVIWYPPDGDMYIYYLPTFWRPAQAGGK